MITIQKQKYHKIGYLRCVPEGFSANNTYPIIIHLHGAGSRGEDLGVLCEQAIIKNAQKIQDFPFVIFTPQCSADCWFDIFEQLKDFVDMVIDLPFVDKKRIYLSGVSMGGYAAWQMLESKNQVFSKAIICCGGGMYWNAGRINASVWAFHGKEDKTVYLKESENMVNAVNRNGGKAKLTVYEGAEHNCWENAYGDHAVYKWLLQE